MRRGIVLVLIAVACGGEDATPPTPGPGPGEDASVDATPPEVEQPTLTCADGIHVMTETGNPAAITVEGHPEENVTRPWPAVDEAVRAAMASYSLVGVSVGVVKDCQVMYLRGYGHEDREANIPVLGRRTMFRWASMSKSITGIVATQAALEGLLDLDAPIETIYEAYAPPTTYLTGDGQELIPEAERAVTSRMLLAHTGGIMHYSNGEGSPEPSMNDAGNPAVNTGMEWALPYFIGKPLVAIPGREYSYTTFGYNLAGVVIEHALGAELSGQVAARVATPAGMSTLQPDHEWADIPHRAVGYEADGSRQGSTDVSWKLAGGGFISTTEDLARFCAGLMSDTLLSDAEKAVAWQPQTTTLGVETAYGLGFDIWYRGENLYIQHSGFQEKANTRYRYYPADGLCIVVMSNDAGADTYELVRGIEDAIRGDQTTDYRLPTTDYRLPTTGSRNR